MEEWEHLEHVLSFIFGDGDSDCEKIDFDEKEMQNVHDELNTAEKGDIITLGSPQLGLDETI